MTQKDSEMIQITILGLSIFFLIGSLTFLFSAFNSMRLDIAIASMLFGCIGFILLLLDNKIEKHKKEEMKNDN